MSKNLLPKTVFIVILVALAIWTLYPPAETLKPGIDLAGGTSLIYAIDTEGLTPDEEKGLAQRMITVLRRRIDPTNIQNLLWRPQGNTRFEIQMPLASKETQRMREQYEEALNALLRQNVNPATIMRSLQAPPAERSEDFEAFAQGDPNRLEILQNLANVYDERTALQGRRDTLRREIESLEQRIEQAELGLETIEANRADWAKLDDEKLREAVSDFLGAPEHVQLVTDYIKTYAEWTDVLGKLTDEGGVNERYEQARRQIDRLNLTEDQIQYVLEMPTGSKNREERIETLKTEFADRAEQIDRVVKAYDAYAPFRGRLDDPRDLQRMLKGAGILEFRILPQVGRAELSNAEIERYVEALREKGPDYASDNRYVWCEIEDPDQWQVPNSIVATFGDTAYVLASNLRPDEVMLRGSGAEEWKLEGAQPSTDQMGRRAIAFQLDPKGGTLFYRITSRNGGRPLCILLDGLAISAPRIDEDRGIGSRGIITGSFTETDVEDMVNKLNAGSLPARLIEQPISEKTIGPSIGAVNRDQGIRAGLIGLVVVMGVMLVYYMLAGTIADVALLLNILFVLAIMAGLSATFTLPGIAGIILTIGMSVDANVLIFERIREEQRKGSGLAIAVKNGYERAFRAIFDANLTTFITAAILYWVASEEIRGFALVLMLGIASSMFTALFVTRVIFDFLVSKRLIKDHLVMLSLIHQPNVNWMGLRKVFLTVSGVLIVGGLLVFFTRNNARSNKYDIEFTGGTQVQINLKPGVELTRKQVQSRIQAIGNDLNNPALAAANVYSVGEPVGADDTGENVYTQYEITTTATNKTNATVTFADAGQRTTDSVRAAIEKAQAEQRRELTDLNVTRQSETAFTVATSRVSPGLVRSVLGEAFPDARISEPEIDEVVSDAVRKAFEGQLEIQQNLQPTIAATERITEETIDTYPELSEYIGGVRIQCELGRAASLDQIDRRIKNLRFKPDTQDLTWYPYAIFGPELKPVEPNEPIREFVYTSVMPEAGLRELSEDEWQQFLQNERARVNAAATIETSLPRVTQVDPSVGGEQKQRAMVAIVLSLSAIVAYVWLRFGSARYGLAAIAALVHDVCITLGAVTACYYLAITPVGQALLIGDFKINLAMIAAFLTLIGYSLNDTIVVFDRIRENRHKAQLTELTITNSINQTISRTIMTSVTTFVVVLVMYIFGGAGLRGFTFAIGLGVLIGTYSSVAIAAPMLLVAGGRGKSRSKKS